MMDANEITRLNAAQPSIGLVLAESYSKLPDKPERVIIPRLEVPREAGDPRFTKSFSIPDNEQGWAEIKAFFDQYGFVVLRDVLDQDNCELTRDLMWSTIESTTKGFRRDDLSTWKRWRSPFGQPGKLPRFEAQLLQNRQSPEIYKLFSEIMGEKELRVSHDRWCIYRPTAASTSTGEDGKKNILPKWATRTNVHLDMNPWHYQSDALATTEALEALTFEDTYDFVKENNLVTQSMGTSVQGLINLCDNLEEDGGLILVPGFQHHFDQWLGSEGQSSLKETDRSYQFSNSSEALQLAQRIPLRAGSIVVWDQRCAHGSKTNNSDQVRMAQFIKMFKASNLPTQTREARAEAVRNQLELQGFKGNISDIGQIVFGIADLSK